MWPRGLRTRACRNCHKVTVLPTCKECGGETAEITVFNAPGADARLRWGLTPREAEVAAQVSAGLTNAQVAVCLGTSVKTIKELLLRARAKMGATNRMQAARMWWEAEA